jgi:hypothetical protein
MKRRFLKLIPALTCAFLLMLPVYGADKKDGAPKGGKTAPAKPVDLNSASQSELEAIPGVGAATAKKIIAGRPYSSTKDLAKAGLPAKTVETITPMVTVGSAPAAAAKTTAVPPPPVPAKVTASTTTSSPAANVVAQTPPAPGMVWVNLETKVYHKQGDRWYGKTRKGTYMTEDDAKRAGYRAAK